MGPLNKPYHKSVDCAYISILISMFDSRSERRLSGWKAQCVISYINITISVNLISILFVKFHEFNYPALLAGLDQPWGRSSLLRHNVPHIMLYRAWNQLGMCMIHFVFHFSTQNEDGAVVIHNVIDALHLVSNFWIDMACLFTRVYTCVRWDILHYRRTEHNVSPDFRKLVVLVVYWPGERT